jgi:hypothetical protein
MPELSLRMSLTVVAILIATSGLAEAQAVTKFDGTYNGVSLTTNGAGQSCVPAVPARRRDLGSADAA